MGDETENLPTATTSNYAADGFDGDDSDEGRLIKGTLIKCDATQQQNHYRYRDGSPVPDRQWLAVGIGKAAQNWRNKRPIETIVEQPGKPLPDIDDLNAATNPGDWETDLNGNPRPPWQVQRIAYLLDRVTCERATFITATVGGRIGIDELKDSVLWMRRLRGQRVAPLIELRIRTMKTKFGAKPSPWFKIVEWANLGGGGDGSRPLIEHQPAEHKLKTVEKPTTEEALNDTIPF
jgi:hypothetical protein